MHSQSHRVPCNGRHLFGWLRTQNSGCFVLLFEGGRPTLHFAFALIPRASVFIYLPPRTTVRTVLTQTVSLTTVLALCLHSSLSVHTDRRIQSNRRSALDGVRLQSGQL
jgi:hypothetical protein